eukprot:TRINITY_DN15177_c0_g1_i1.p1 TRINITY_DN15177_c0_g1~~TRINITY_DN15177_c0_g1_i1.p1  ORF type:complete len:182 (+),score=27.23 TRINITY_DN15177_c0_g1_i1:108-653(+)
MRILYIKIKKHRKSLYSQKVKKEIFKAYQLSQISKKQEYFCENFGEILVQGRKQFILDQENEELNERHLTLGDLIKTIDSMNLSPELDSLSKDGLFRFDILIRYQEFQVAVLFFNELHHTRSQPFKILNEQQNKIQQLKFRGYKTIGVSVYDWPWKQRRAFKRELFNSWLQKAVLEDETKD